jgi:hypothetical protein
MLHSNEMLPKVWKRTFERPKVVRYPGKPLGLADSDIIRALVAHGQWSLRRHRGAHLIPTKFQSALKVFKDYLQRFSGLVNIVQQADNQFGGLAYSTLSIFLAVGTSSIPSSGPDTENIERWRRINRKRKVC